MPLSFGQGVILESHPHVLATPDCACTADPLTLSFLPPENMTKTMAMSVFLHFFCMFLPHVLIQNPSWDQRNTTGPNKRISSACLVQPKVQRQRRAGTHLLQRLEIAQVPAAAVMHAKYWRIRHWMGKHV